VATAGEDSVAVLVLGRREDSVGVGVDTGAVDTGAVGDVDAGAVSNIAPDTGGKATSFVLAAKRGFSIFNNQ
jgi:hypothetical protein